MAGFSMPFHQAQAAIKTNATITSSSPTGSSSCGSSSSRYRKVISKDQLAPAILKFFFPKDITFEMIRNEFGKPMKEAAAVLEVSVTKLKRLCRQFKLKRWPYRKIKRIEAEIKELTLKTPQPENLKEKQMALHQQLHLLITTGTSGADDEGDDFDDGSSVCSSSKRPKRRDSFDADMSSDDEDNEEGSNSPKASRKKRRLSPVQQQKEQIVVKPTPVFSSLGASQQQYPQHPQRHAPNYAGAASIIQYQQPHPIVQSLNNNSNNNSNGNSLWHNFSSSSSFFASVVASPVSPPQVVQKESPVQSPVSSPSNQQQQPAEKKKLALSFILN